MEQKKVTVAGRDFILNKIPAFDAQKIAMACFNAFAKRDFSAIPDDILLKLMSYVTVEQSGVSLGSKEFIDLNVPDAAALLELEALMIDLNFGFFSDGGLLARISDILGRLIPQGQKQTSTDSEETVS